MKKKDKLKRKQFVSRQLTIALYVIYKCPLHPGNHVKLFSEELKLEFPQDIFTITQSISSYQNDKKKTFFCLFLCLKASMGGKSSLFKKIQKRYYSKFGGGG